VHIGDSVGYYSPEERLLRHRRGTIGHWSGCYAGCQAIGIQSDGGIKGCLSLQPREGEEDRFIEGNVHECSLEEIWFRPGAFSYNRDFNTDDLSGDCATCSFAEVCRGGAKCVAQAFHGDVGCDPLCYHAALMKQADCRRPAWAHAAASAAAAMVLGLGGAACSAATPIESDSGPNNTPDYGDPSYVDADVGGRVDTGPILAPDYGDPDYGVLPGDAGVDASADTGPIVTPDYGEPDYGVIPVDASVDAQYDGPINTPDYGVVDYGVIPFDASVDASTDATVDPCEEVDCSCAYELDYGMAGPEPCVEMSLYESCCCEDIECEASADYGVFEPPPYPQSVLCCDENHADLDYGDVPPDFSDDYGVPEPDEKS
jgi:radical SAM protein with 4Fe4S-binding SPASM domain